MTDPEMADRTYIEPITPEAVEKIIARERPDALLADTRRTNRPQHSRGAGRKRRAEKIQRGNDRGIAQVIHKAEDREKFRHAMEKIGLRMPKSGFARSMNDVLENCR